MLSGSLESPARHAASRAGKHPSLSGAEASPSRPPPSSHPPPSSRPPPSSHPPPPPLAGSLLPQAASPLPQAAALRRALGATLAPAGPQTGTLVYDMTAHTTVLSVRAGIPRPPASVEKIYTSVAALRKLGPAAELLTAVMGTGHLGAGGVWDGNLYLRGGGDPTFGDGAFNRVSEQGYGPTATELGAQLRRDGIRRVTGSLIADSSLFDGAPGGPATNFRPDIPDYYGELGALTYDHGATTAAWPSPATFAAHELASTLRGMGSSVTASHQPGVTPPTARVLASISSPPLSVLLRLMDVPSDDLMADMLAKQLGALFGADGTLGAGARVISSQIAAYGLQPAIVDGSGLSRDDLSSPLQVVDLLRAVWGTPVGEVLRSALPVVGRTGTVETLGVRTPAAGHCVAKTGTLTDVTNLAGYCRSKARHLVAFAVFIDGPASWQAFPMLSRAVGEIAAY